jgi:WhiB family transcriptional regulator, redox-sensing transcriptional regulator
MAIGTAPAKGPLESPNPPPHPMGQPRLRLGANPSPVEGFVKAFTFTSNFSATRGDGAAMDWRHSAVCREEDPELFFPIGNTGPALLQIEEAKAVCRRCPVMEQCLQWALESGQDSGVWGGLSEDERRAMKRRAARNRARQATA